MSTLHLRLKNKPPLLGPSKKEAFRNKKMCTLITKIMKPFLLRSQWRESVVMSVCYTLSCHFKVQAQLAGLVYFYFFSVINFRWTWKDERLYKIWRYYNLQVILINAVVLSDTQMPETYWTYWCVILTFCFDGSRINTKERWRNWLSSPYHVINLCIILDQISYLNNTAMFWIKKKRKVKRKV